MTAFITFNDLPLSLETTIKRSSRSQRTQFGDGYSQILTDGLNAQHEMWSCNTGPILDEDAYGIESFLLRRRGQPISWTPPNATKVFTGQFESGTLDLGYENLASLVLTGYSRPGNYTANLSTGLLTSVTIANLVDVPISLTLNPRDYIIEDGWQLSFINGKYFRLSFNLRQVYV